jgi:hypothetical protein
MSEMSFRLVDHFDSDAPILSVDHMGDGMFVVIEKLEDGATERVCLTVAQITELYTRASRIYGTRGMADMAKGSFAPEIKAL